MPMEVYDCAPGEIWRLLGVEGEAREPKPCELSDDGGEAFVFALFTSLTGVDIPSSLDVIEGDGLAGTALFGAAGLESEPKVPINSDPIKSPSFGGAVSPEAPMRRDDNDGAEVDGTVANEDPPTFEALDAASAVCLETTSWNSSMSESEDKAGQREERKNQKRKNPAKINEKRNEAQRVERERSRAS